MGRYQLIAVITAAGAMAFGVGSVVAQEVKPDQDKVTKSSDVTVPESDLKFDPNAKVCKKVTYTGSRLGTAKICKKRSEWADRAFHDQKQTERIQHNTKPHISR